MAITLTSDFVGEYKLNKSCFDDLELFIAKYEPFYLVRLLGADLYALFNADLTPLPSPQVPQTSPYTELFEPFTIDDGSCLYLSDGIKTMLVQLIYFHFTRESNYRHTQSGMTTPNQENSNMMPYKGYNDIDAYNAGISNYQTIQWYICDNPIDSAVLDDEFNGIHLEYTSGI
jgi:hypothetical protein